MITAIALSLAILTWTAPTLNADGSPLTNLAAYRIRWGTTSGGPYTGEKLIPAPASTNTVTDLPLTRVYFVIRAVAADGDESVNSNEVMKNFTDTDADGVYDTVDNCSQRKNPSQCNTDGDSYGNFCDGDLNNNGIVNAQDYSIFRDRLGSSDADADFNCNGIVNAQDYAIFRPLQGAPPGPGAIP